MNLSATRHATTTNTTRLSVIALKELGRSARSVRRLCRLDEESLETRCAFCDQPWAVNGLGNYPSQSCALAGGGTGQAVRLGSGCPILYPLSGKTEKPSGSMFYLKTEKTYFQGFEFFRFLPNISSSDTEKNKSSVIPLNKIDKIDPYARLCSFFPGFMLPSSQTTAL